MTVRENMSFALKIAKKSRAEIDAAVNNAAQILQLDEYLDRLPKALSGGQRQRVAIGGRLCATPKFICSTNRSRTLTPPCGWRPGSRSRA